MASGGLYSSIYITIHSLINYLCALDTTLRILNQCVSNSLRILQYPMNNTYNKPPMQDHLPEAT